MYCTVLSNHIILSFCMLFTHDFYRPQTKFAKVMFLQVSVILSTGGACMVARGGVRGCLGGSMHGCSGGGS